MYCRCQEVGNAVPAQPAAGLMGLPSLYPQQSQQKPVSLTLLMVQSQREEKIEFESALESVGMQSFLNDF